MGEGKGSSSPAVAALASLGLIGRAIWRNWTLTAVPAFGFAMGVSPNLDGKVGAGCAAAFAVMLWAQERLTIGWRKSSEAWRELAGQAIDLLQPIPFSPAQVPDAVPGMTSNPSTPNTMERT